MNELSLFSGYGGFSLGLRLAGLQTRTVMYVEWERYPQEVLKARIRDGFLDDAPIWGDISTLDGTQFRGLVDVITAGFPCQPHSVAGLHRGANDDRNLWPETLRVIREVGPRYVLLENVPGILSSSTKRGTPAYGGTVVGQLAQEGYRVRWDATLGADDIGAPHRRKRWWCIGVADSANHGRKHETRGEYGQPLQATGTQAVGITGSGDIEELADSDSQRGRSGITHREDAEDVGQPPEAQGCHGAIPVWPPSPNDTDGWERVIRERPDLAPALSKEVESQFRGVDDGRSHRVDELKALGNGLVPRVVAEFLWRLENE